MAACFYHRLISVTHGGTTITKPVRASINGNTEWATSDGAGAVTDECLGARKVTHEAEVICEDPITPITHGTSATLTINIEADDGTSGSVSCPTMLAGATGFSAGGGNAQQRHTFRYKGASLNPLTVSA